MRLRDAFKPSGNSVKVADLIEEKMEKPVEAVSLAIETLASISQLGDATLDELGAGVMIYLDRAKNDERFPFFVRAAIAKIQRVALSEKALDLLDLVRKSYHSTGGLDGN